MQIQAANNTTLILKLYYLLFNRIYLRVKLFYRIFPSPIHIETSKIASIVAVYNSIYVYHWKYSELVSLEETFHL